MRANDWRAIEVPALGEWSPDRSVTVIVPAGGDQARLSTTVAALIEQTYPRALTQVLLVGEPPGEPLDGAAELDADFVAGDPEGQRPLDAVEAAARGDILLFVDEGLVLPRRALDAHARWHHAIGDAAVLGVRRAIAGGPVDPGAVAAAARSDELASLLGGEEAANDDWVEEALESTNRLTDERLDLFRVGSRGSLSVRAETLAGAGGPGLPPSVDPHGIELAYRLFTYGAILVPDDDAAGWQRAPEPRPQDGADGLELERLVPVGGFRRRDSGLIRAVPAIHVTVAVGDQPAAAVAERVGLLLASGAADVSVALELEPGYPERSGWRRRSPRILGSRSAGDGAGRLSR